MLKTRGARPTAVRPHVAFDKNWCGRAHDYAI